MESYYASFLERVIYAIEAGAKAITQEAKLALANFIAIQIPRTPINRKFHQQDVIKAGQEVERRIKAGILPQTSSAIERLAAFKQDNFKDVMLNHMINELPAHYVEQMMKKEWVFWFNKSTQPFITSDNPIG